MIRKLITFLTAMALFFTTVVGNFAVVVALTLPQHELGTPERPKDEYSWYVSDNPNVVNHRGNKTLVGDFAPSTSPSPRPWNTSDFTNDYVMFEIPGTSNENFAIRQMARETTPGLFEVVTNIRGNSRKIEIPIDIVLVADHSTSMVTSSSLDASGVRRTRLYYLDKAIESFSEYLHNLVVGMGAEGRDLIRIGHIAFGSDIIAGKTLDLADIYETNNLNALKNVTPATTPTNYTFTQLGVREGAKLFDTPSGDTRQRQQIMILLTDGVPTYSNAITSAEDRNRNGVIDIGEVTGTSSVATGTIVGNNGSRTVTRDIDQSGTNSNSGLTPRYISGETSGIYYNSTFPATLYEIQKLLGQNGLTRPDNINNNLIFEVVGIGLGNVAAESYAPANTYAYNNEVVSFTVSGYRLANGTLQTIRPGSGTYTSVRLAYRHNTNGTFATSTPTNQLSNYTLVEVTAVNITLPEVTVADITAKFSGTVGADRFFNIPDAQLAFLHQELLKPVREFFATVNNGTFTNVVGDQFILEPNSMSASLYTVRNNVGSNPVTVPSQYIVPNGNGFNVTNLNLGVGEEIRITHQVRLNTEANNFVPEQWYFISNHESTTFRPTPTSDAVRFLVPSGKGPGTEITLNKVWNDLDNKYGNRPTSVTFEVGRTNTTQGWSSALAVLNAPTETSNTWNGKFNELFIPTNAQPLPVRMAKYNILGQPITYNVVREVNVPDGYTSFVDTVTNTITNVLNPRLNLDKYDQQTNTPLAGATFTLTNNVNSETITGVTDENGKIASLTNLQLIPGRTYTLTENRRDGFEQAGPWSFTVNNDGTITGLTSTSNLTNTTVFDATTRTVNFSVYNVRQELVRLQVTNIDTDFDIPLPGTTYHLTNDINNLGNRILTAGTDGILREVAGQDYVYLNPNTHYYLVQYGTVGRFGVHPYVWHVRTPERIHRTIPPTQTPGGTEVITPQEDEEGDSFNLARNLGRLVIDGALESYETYGIEARHYATRANVGTELFRLLGHESAFRRDRLNIQRNEGTTPNYANITTVNFEIYHGITYDFTLLKVDGMPDDTITLDEGETAKPSLSPLQGAHFNLYRLNTKQEGHKVNVVGNVTDFNKLTTIPTSHFTQLNDTDLVTDVNGKITSSLQRGVVYVFIETKAHNPHYMVADYVLVVYMDEDQKLHYRFANMRSDVLEFITDEAASARYYGGLENNIFTFLNFERDNPFNFRINKVDGDNVALPNIDAQFRITRSNRDITLANLDSVLSNINNFRGFGYETVNVKGIYDITLAQGIVYLFEETHPSNAFFSIPNVQFLVFMDETGYINIIFVQPETSTVDGVETTYLRRLAKDDSNPYFKSFKRNVTGQAVEGSTTTPILNILTFANFRIDREHYGFSLTKVDSISHNKLNAQFELLQSDSFILSSDLNSVITNNRFNAIPNGNATRTILSTTNGILTIPNTDLLQGTVYKLREVTPPDAFYQLSDVSIILYMDENGVKHTLYVDNDTNAILTEAPKYLVPKTEGSNFTTDIVWSNFRVEPETYNFSLRKVSSVYNDRGLAGAQFALYQSSDEFIINFDEVLETTTFSQLGEAVTTDANGFITFNNLTQGKIYFLREVAAPEGYYKIENIGLAFIKDSSGNIVRTFINYTLNEDGSFVLGNPILESNVPYLVANTSYTTTTTVEGQEQTVTGVFGNDSNQVVISNNKIMTDYSFDLVKVYGESTPLAGVEFTLSRYTGDPVNFSDATTLSDSFENVLVEGQPRVFTSSTSAITINNLEQRVIYRLTETKAPTYFALATEYILVYKDYDGNIIFRFANDSTEDTEERILNVFDPTSTITITNPDTTTTEQPVSNYFVSLTNNTLTFRNFRSEVDTYTFNINKVDIINTNIPVDASFTLERSSQSYILGDNWQEVALSDTFTNVGTYRNYVVNTNTSIVDGAINTTITNTINNNGVINFGELEQGVIYRIKEASVNSRYILAEETIFVFMDEEGIIHVSRLSKTEAVDTEDEEFVSVSILESISESPYYVSLSEDNVTLTFANAKEVIPGQFTLHKVDSIFHRNLVATFDVSTASISDVLRNQDSLTIDDLNDFSFGEANSLPTSDEEGKIDFDLNPGSIYLIVETKAPAGYDKVENLAIIVYINYEDEVVAMIVEFDDEDGFTSIKDIEDINSTFGNSTLVFLNNRIVETFDFSLTKVDGIFGHGLEGAEFSLESAPTPWLDLDDEDFDFNDLEFESVTSIESDENGLVSLKDLTLGNIYKLTETSAPELYDLNTEGISIIFYLDYEGELVVRYFRTSNDGLEEVTDITNSRYLNETENGIELSNFKKVIYFDYSITKVDGIFGHGLEGAVFSLQSAPTPWTTLNNLNVNELSFTNVDLDLETDGVQYTRASDENGLVSLKGLQFGNIYRLTETIAPEDYDLNTEGISIIFYLDYEGELVVRYFRSITNDENVTTLEEVEDITNSRYLNENANGIELSNFKTVIYFDYSITKVDGIFGHGLEGAVFSLQSAPTPWTTLNNLNVNVLSFTNVDLDLETDGVQYTRASDENGQVSFTGLQFGNIYKLTETSAPEHYALNTEGISIIFYLDYEGVLQTRFFRTSTDGLAELDEDQLATSRYLNVTNTGIELLNFKTELTFNFELTKVDGIYDTGLAGAVFSLQSAPTPWTTLNNLNINELSFTNVDLDLETEGVQNTVTSATNGLVSLEGLVSGYVYRLTETTPPTGYSLTTNGITIIFYLDYDGTLQTRFFRTSTDGIVELDEDQLEASRYLNVIVDEEENEEIRLSNFRQVDPFEFTLTKVDGVFGTGLGGATFSLQEAATPWATIDTFNINNLQFVDITPEDGILSDSDGTVTIDGLTFGSVYKLTEIEAPTNYALSTEGITIIFYLDYDGELVIRYFKSETTVLTDGEETVTSTSLDELSPDELEASRYLNVTEEGIELANFKIELDLELEFTKIDGLFESALPGATFTLESVATPWTTFTSNFDFNTLTFSNTGTRTFTSNAQGIVSITGLTSNYIYILTETGAPTGYELSNVSIIFYLDYEGNRVIRFFESETEDGETSLVELEGTDINGSRYLYVSTDGDITFSNFKEMVPFGFELTKVDGVTNVPLNAGFTLTSSVLDFTSPLVISELTFANPQTINTAATETNELGSLVLTDLQHGYIYRLVETTPPTGYDLSNIEIYIYRDYEGVVHTRFFTRVENVLEELIGTDIDDSRYVSYTNNHVVLSNFRTEFDFVLDKLSTEEGNPAIANATFEFSTYALPNTDLTTVDINHIEFVHDDTLVSSNAEGKVNFTGLTSGVIYQLVETIPAPGFDLPTVNPRIIFFMNDSGEVVVRFYIEQQSYDIETGEPDLDEQGNIISTWVEVSEEELYIFGGIGENSAWLYNALHVDPRSTSDIFSIRKVDGTNTSIPVMATFNIYLYNGVDPFNQDFETIDFLDNRFTLIESNVATDSNGVIQRNLEAGRVYKFVEVSTAPGFVVADLVMVASLSWPETEDQHINQKMTVRFALDAGDTLMFVPDNAARYFINHDTFAQDNQTVVFGNFPPAPPGGVGEYEVEEDTTTVMRGGRVPRTGQDNMPLFLGLAFTIIGLGSIVIKRKMKN